MNTRLTTSILSFLSAVAACALEVTNTTDAGVGSLRDAITNTPPGGTVIFAAGLDGDTIILATGQFTIAKNLTIDASALTNGITIDGDNLSRVFWIDVNTAPTVTMNGLSIINGSETTASGSSFPRGGGIYLGGGDLALVNCTLNDNSASVGGGIYCWAGAFTFTNCTVSGNSADQNGGGFYILGPGIGVVSDCTLINCTLEENSAVNTGGGIHTGGDVSHGTVSLALSKCTLSSNTTTNSNGGGLYIGASVNGPNITAALDNCTFSENSAGFQGGAISAADSNALAITLSITSCTLSGNSADFDGGGIFVNDAHFTLTASIVSGNTAVHNQAQGPNIRRINGPDGAVSITNNLVGGSANLAPLGNYGGTTETMPPLFGSPVIDAGGNSDPGGTDQRGSPRFVGGALDRGAVEVLVVDTAIDENDGVATGGVSLRDAIAAVPTGSTLTFAPILSGGTITLTNGQLLIEDDLVIDASALADGITIDANGMITNHRVLQIDDDATVALHQLTLTGGKTVDGSAGDGGGIHNSGDLTLTDCSVSANAAGSGGGGEGGGIYNDNFANASLTLTRCRVSDNTTGGGGGGGIFNGLDASLALTDCTVSGNVTGNGSGNSNGGSGGGICQFSDASSTFVGCTISGNSTGNGGSSAGHGGAGGGIYVLIGSPVLTHCTIAGNVTGEGGGTGGAGSGGGIYVSSGDSITLTHCTVSANSTGGIGSGTGGGTGGGIRDLGDLTFTNSIISGNALGSPGSGADLAEDGGSLTRSGINFIGDLTGSGLSASGTLLNGDAMLSTLGDFGGLTETMPPLSGSPVIDPAGGDPTSPFAFDQRGFVRVSNGTVDIGAVEYDLRTYLAQIWELDSDGDGHVFGIEYALGTDWLVADLNSPNNPAIFSNASGEIEFSFGLNPVAVPDTIWVVLRSTDLLIFTEIYRYDGPSTSSIPGLGVTAVVGASNITMTDTNPPSPHAFYRIRADLAP